MNWFIEHTHITFKLLSFILKQPCLAFRQVDHFTWIIVLSLFLLAEEYFCWSHVPFSFLFFSCTQASKMYAKAEVSLHNQRTDCWIIIKDKVFFRFHCLSLDIEVEYLPILPPPLPSDNCLDFPHFSFPFINFFYLAFEQVYDVTPYVEEHPGGDAILAHAGDDSTDGFFGLILFPFKLVFPQLENFPPLSCPPYTLIRNQKKIRNQYLLLLLSAVWQLV